MRLHFVFLLAVATVSASNAANMTPIALTGFNRDLVIENNASGPPFTSAAAEFNPNENTVFYQAGLAGTAFGLPVSGLFTSALGDGTSFQFQPYTGNNALVFSLETGASSGSLALSVPAVYRRIAILANSANGGGTPNVTLHFSDGSTFVTNYNAQDWFFNTANVALLGMDRIDLDSGNTDGGPDNPRFYQTTIDLAGLFGSTNKPLSSISFDEAAGVGATAIYAVSGELAANMTPVAVSGFNRDVVIENIASGPPYTGAALELNPGEGTGYYVSGLPGKNYGLPVSGSFANGNDGATFQFQPYTANNALVLSSETAISSGTLTLASPTAYNRIAIIANSANGDATGLASLTLQFDDNSTLVTNYYAPNWFNESNGALYDIALQSVERIDLTSGATTGMTIASTNNPRFYETTIDLTSLPGASTKPLASITFGMATGTSAGQATATAIYAVSGSPASPFALATVTNLPATGVQTSAATVPGQVISTGGDVPAITLYYGTADGGTNVGNWPQSVVLGTQSGSFTQAISGLSFHTTYYYTFKAVNGGGTSWAAPSGSFTTLTPVAATITNLPATGVQGTSATLNGQVLSAGGDTPNVTLFYGPADGGTTVSGWSNNVPLGTVAGTFSQAVFGLSTNTTYYFTARAVNAAGTTWAAPSRFFTTLTTNLVQLSTAVLTYHNDNTRWGVNPNETMLTLANVNTNSFGKIFSYAVDGFVYAQPLIMTNVNIPGKGVHNVVYVATEHNSVYAFDADDNSGANAAPLWQTSFLGPGVTTVPNGDVGTTDITPEIGITSTPVIDPVTGTIYLEVKTKEPGPVYVHRLHALDIATGLERANFNSPAVITCTNYPGNGTSGYTDNDGKGHVSWNPLREHSRPALTLLNGVVYMSFASHGDNQPYHGWFLGYNATNVAQQVGVYNATPNGAEGGFWDGGGGPSVDPQGNLYFQTGNGSFDGDNSLSTASSYAMSLLKLATTNGITLVDYFAPNNAVDLSDSDQDLGSAAPMILPDSAGSVAHRHLVMGGGKTAPIYLVDRDNMGRFNGTSGTNRIVQQFNGGPGGDRDTSPAFFNNTLYNIDSNSRIGAYTITNALFDTTPVETPDTYANKGGATASISANGTGNAILWAIYNSGGQSPATPCVLRAYNATNLTQKLYSSDQLSSRDAAGTAVKFTTPTIANGKVYVGAQYSLSVYGTGVFLATPVISPNGGVFTNSVMVSIIDASPGTTIYYTLDNSTPTTNSLLYTGPFDLQNSVNVQAVAVKPGSVNSGVASATFLNSSAIGSGTGLLGSYWSNTTSAAFADPGFNTAATLIRTDAVVNFNWGNGSPDASISADTFTARWTGSVQPQFSETYTFYTTTDDGVRLWVNGQLLIDQWVDQGPTEWSGSITLAAQQRYNIRMDYYENGGGAAATLSWSSPSTTKDIIPQAQLYPVTNPPPVVILNSPANNSTYTATASVTMSANAAAQYNDLDRVDFYVGGNFIGSASDIPYSVTATGLGAGGYNLTAVAVDGSGLSSTSAPVHITINAGSGQPYGLTSNAPVTPFLNMPATSAGVLPGLLSGTGAFSDTPNRVPAGGLIPYVPNTPLWSDAAVKSRYLAVPGGTGTRTPDEQIGFLPTNSWTFPAGTVFVKNFDLVVNETNASVPLRRLETRLLVRDINGTVYGVSYKWRADNSEADRLLTSLNENILITNATGVRTQTWYYPSPSDCLTCHTPAAGYVLGLNTRQLNREQTYPATGVTDNQLRTLNRLGLFNPAFNEAGITNFDKLSALTNVNASLEERVRSYLDANCAQCHQPGGTGPTFDARYDTPLTNQNIINGILAKGDLGYDNAKVVVPKDIWRSILYQRSDSLDNSVKMPPLARNLVDTNGMAVMAAWINSLLGTPALAPPTITPNGSVFLNSINVSIQSTNGGDTLYYTLDGSLPDTGSLVYGGSFNLTSNAIVKAKAFKTGFNDSVAATAAFTLQLPVVAFTSDAFFTNNIFQMQVSGMAGKNYFLEGSTNLIDWISLGYTNTAISNLFYLDDPKATNFRQRFYRAIELP